MRQFYALAILLLLGEPGEPRAHEIIQNVSRSNAVVIELLHPDRSPLGFAQFEIYRGSDEMPYQTGKSDALGRIVFVPDRQASWRIRAFSEDGHGTDMTIDAGPEPTSGTVEYSDPMRNAKIVFGLIAIIALFMIVVVFIRRRTV